MNYKNYIGDECKKIKLNNPDKSEALKEINKFYDGLIIKKLHEANYIKSLQIIGYKEIHKIEKRRKRNDRKY